MSWPSVIILVPVDRRPLVEGRIRAFELVPDPVTGDDRLHWHGYSYSIDLSSGILSDYESDELDHAAWSSSVTSSLDSTGSSTSTTTKSCRRASSLRSSTATPTGTGGANRAPTSNSRLIGTRSPAGPDQNGRKVQGSLISDCEFVRPHCQAAPLLESSDAPLNSNALLVCLSVEAGWTTSDAASAQSVADPVRRLRDDGTDAASTEMATDCAGGVGVIRKDDRWTGSWPAESRSAFAGPGFRPRPPRRPAHHRPGPPGHGWREAAPGCHWPGGLSCSSRRGSVRARDPPARSGREPPFPRSGRVLVSPAAGGVHGDCPAHIIVSIGYCKDSCDDPCPCAIHGPPDQTSVSGLKGSELVRQVAPRQAGAVIPRDGLKSAAVVSPPSSTGRIGRHQRLQLPVLRRRRPRPRRPRATRSPPCGGR